MELIDSIVIFINTYGIILLLLGIIPIVFWCCWYGNTRKIRDYLKNIDENNCEAYKRNIEQNERIIANQEKIIALLEGKRPSNGDTNDC